MLKIHALVRNMQAYIGWYLEMSTHGIHATLDQLSDTVLDAKIRYQKGKEKRKKERKEKTKNRERNKNPAGSVLHNKWTSPPSAYFSKKDILFIHI